MGRGVRSIAFYAPVYLVRWEIIAVVLASWMEDGYTPLVRVEWNRQKAEDNLAKHGVSFEEAQTVFHNPLARIFDDEAHSADENREIIIGHSVLNRLVLVCFTERREVIRLFSARRATPKERKDYEEKATI
jgi:uncharacterized protein